MDASNTETRPVVLVTNAKELTSTHIIRQLIEGEEYMVRGTVADLKNKDIVRPIRNLTKDPEPEPEPEVESPTAKDEKKEEAPEKAENVEVTEEKDKEEVKEEKEEKVAEDNKESEKKESEAAEGQEEKKDAEKEEETKSDDAAKEEKTEEKVEEKEEEEPEEEIDESKLQVVELDLTKEETIDAAVKGCSFVIHNAGLLFKSDAVAPTEEETKAAVDGTVALLKACKTNKVKRVVFISHLSTVTGTALITNDAEKTYNEEDWADVEKADAITKARVQVEKAAWDFVKELTEEEKFELVVLNPPSVLGPVLLGKQSVMDSDLVKKLLERGMQVVSKLYMPVADVRDVATANINALTLEAAVGQRYVVMSQGMWLRDIAMILSKEFKPQGYSVPTMHCPAFGVKLLSFVNKNHKNQLPNIGKSYKIDNGKLKDVLNVEVHTVKSTLLDMGHSLIRNGVVKKAKKYKGPRPEGEEEEVKPEAVNGAIANSEEKAENKEEKAEEKEEKEEEKVEEKVEEKKEEKTEDKPEEKVEEKKAEEPEKPTEETPAPKESEAPAAESTTESTTEAAAPAPTETTESKPDTAADE